MGLVILYWPAVPFDAVSCSDGEPLVDDGGSTEWTVAIGGGHSQLENRDAVRDE